MKYLSRISLISLALLLGLALIIVGHPAPVKTSPERYLTLSSDGSVKVVPDGVQISATVSAVDKSSANALTSVGLTASVVRVALKSHKIDINDIASQNMSVYPEYDYANNSPKLKGYRASQGFLITVRNSADAGNVVDAMVGAGGDNLQLNSVTPVLLDTEKATNSARELAVRNAKLKAVRYEELMGVKLGKINYLVETPGTQGSPYPPIYASASKDTNMMTSSVDLGQQDVTVSVTVQWQLVS